MTGKDDLPKALAKDFEHAPVTDKERAMLRYAAQVTTAPSEISRGDMQALRDAGFSDGAILDICQVAAYFAFVNRLAGGLGVELES